jgi:hypothetical protein
MAHQLTAEIIQAAIEGLRARQETIAQQIAELRAMLPARSGSADGNAASRKQGGRKPLSAAARARIAAAQRKRWAVARGESQPATASSAKPAKKKRRLSPEGRRAIQEGARKRWAAKRAEAAKPAATKKAAKAGKHGPRRQAAKLAAPAESGAATA